MVLGRGCPRLALCHPTSFSKRRQPPQPGQPLSALARRCSSSRPTLLWLSTSSGTGGRDPGLPLRAVPKTHAMICRSNLAPVMNSAASKVIVRDMPVLPS
jgi:hypothetical protein